MLSSKRSLAYLSLLITAAIWGVAVPVIKYTLNFIDPLTFLFFRFLLSSVILLPFFLIFVREHPLSKKDFFRLFLLGNLSTTINLYLLFWGMKYTTAIDESLISLLGPIMVVFAGAHFLKEKIEKRERVGLSIAVVGAIIAIFEPLIKRNSHPQAFFGNFLIFLSWVDWTVYAILYKKSSLKYHPLEITFFNFFSGLITITFIFLIKIFSISQFLSFSISLPTAALPGILYMSIFSSCIAYFAYNLGVSLIEVSEATLFDYLKPVFTAPLAFFWLKEDVSSPFLIGALIITLGVAISEWR